MSYLLRPTSSSLFESTPLSHHGTSVLVEEPEATPTHEPNHFGDPSSNNSNTHRRDWTDVDDEEYPLVTSLPMKQLSSSAMVDASPTSSTNVLRTEQLLAIQQSGSGESNGSSLEFRKMLGWRRTARHGDGGYAYPKRSSTFWDKVFRLPSAHSDPLDRQRSSGAGVARISVGHSRHTQHSKDVLQLAQSINTAVTTVASSRRQRQSVGPALSLSRKPPMDTVCIPAGGRNPETSMDDDDSPSKPLLLGETLTLSPASSFGSNLTGQRQPTETPPTDFQEQLLVIDPVLRRRLVDELVVFEDIDKSDDSNEYPTTTSSEDDGDDEDEDDEDDDEGFVWKSMEDSLNYENPEVEIELTGSTNDRNDDEEEDRQIWHGRLGKAIAGWNQQQQRKHRIGYDRHDNVILPTVTTHGKDRKPKSLVSDNLSNKKLSKANQDTDAVGNHLAAMHPKQHQTSSKKEVGRVVPRVYKPTSITTVPYSPAGTSITKSSTEIGTPESIPEKKRVTFQPTWDDEEEKTEVVCESGFDASTEPREICVVPPLPLEEQEEEDYNDDALVFSKSLHSYMIEWREATAKLWNKKELVRNEHIPKMAVLSTSGSRLIPIPDVQRTECSISVIGNENEAVTRAVKQIIQGEEDYEMGFSDADLLVSKEFENLPMEKSVFSSSLALYLHEWRHKTKSSWDRRDVIRQRGLPLIVMTSSTKHDHYRTSSTYAQK